TRHLLGVEAVGIDSVGDARFDAERRQDARLPRPKVEVFAAMAGRRVHKTGSRIVGDVLAFEQRHRELVAGDALGKRVRAGFDVVWIDAADALEFLHSGSL